MICRCFPDWTARDQVLDYVWRCYREQASRTISWTANTLKPQNLNPMNTLIRPAFPCQSVPSERVPTSPLPLPPAPTNCCRADIQGEKPAIALSRARGLLPQQL